MSVGGIGIIMAPLTSLVVRTPVQTHTLNDEEEEVVLVHQ